MVQSNPFLDLGAWMFRYLDAQMLKCLDTWLHGCSDAQLHMLTVLSTVHCPIISCFLTVVRCVTILGEFDILSKKICRIFTLCLCNVIFSIAQKFLCVGLAMCISIYIYDGLCIRSESRCICSARHLWPSPPGREPTMESGGIVPNPTPLLLLNTVQRNLAVQRIFLSQCSCTVAVQRNSPRPERPSLLP